MGQSAEYSILMSVYKNTKPCELKECLDSLYRQSVTSGDIVIVLDGPVSPEVSALLEAEKKNHAEITLCPIEQNVGLGNALRHGMQFCKNELIARMDTDDIAVDDRFSKQLQCFERDETLSIVGGDIAEFIDNAENIVSYRRVPKAHEDIAEFLKKRCPFNHMTVMFKKSEVERAGGYLDWHYNEDSYLWARMFLAGCKFQNIGEVLVFARIGIDTFKRRGGRKYYKSERDLFKFMFENEIITRHEYRKAVSVRFIAYVLMPNRMRAWLFKKAVRQPAQNDDGKDIRDKTPDNLSESI